jgi:hypothetical protein
MEFIAAHCEALYAFVRSRLNRFFVVSSLESLKEKFRDSFDPTLGRRLFSQWSCFGFVNSKIEFVRIAGGSALSICLAF